LRNILKPHRKQQWVIPPDSSAAFVANMEDVLEVYQPHASARVPRRNLEAADHRDPRADPREAGTQGTSRLRIRTQWRRQSVHGVRAAGRVAACDFPDAAKIVLVQDNLNTHKPASLYEAFLVAWQFKTADARVKLKRLYPQFG
jgi:hypothetical protein